MMASSSLKWALSSGMPWFCVTDDRLPWNPNETPWDPDEPGWEFAAVEFFYVVRPT
jgi:hypothetical protein